MTLRWLLLLCLSLPGWAQPRFHVELEKPVTRVGEPIMVRLVLTNPTGQPLRVNRRMLVHRPAPLEHEVIINVSGPEGEVPFRLRMRVGAADPDLHFVTLQPGRSSVVDYDLGYAYGIRTPGTYRAEARYENFDERGWVGKLLAPSLEFRVE